MTIDAKYGDERVDMNVIPPLVPGEMQEEDVNDLLGEQISEQLYTQVDATVCASAGVGTNIGAKYDINQVKQLYDQVGITVCAGAGVGAVVSAIM